MTLNIPTGTPLGTYAGTMYFFNDRGVRFVQGAGQFGTSINRSPISRRSKTAR